jgi:hypothetical protein
MDKEKLIEELEAYLAANPNPYTYAYIAKDEYLDGNEFKGFISETWRIGGMEGGSCWHEADTHITPEEPHDLTLLDDFLESRMPELSFVKYRNLLKLVKTLEWGRSEYYGNYYRYKCSYISFDDIVDFLTQ